MKRRLIKEYKFNTPNPWDAVFSAPVYYKDETIYYPYGMSSTRFCRKIKMDGRYPEVWKSGSPFPIRSVFKTCRFISGRFFITVIIFGRSYYDE